MARTKGSYNKKFGLKVVEADDDLTLKLLQVDIDTAEKHRVDNPNDPANSMCCAVAQMVTRHLGEGQCAIMRRVAYVAYPGDNVTRRYLLDEKSFNILSAFDKGEQIVPGVEVKLRKPSKSHTLANLRKKNREYGQKMKGVTRPVTKRKNRKADPLAGVVRNGNIVRWT